MPRLGGYPARLAMPVARFGSYPPAYDLGAKDTAAAFRSGKLARGAKNEVAPVFLLYERSCLNQRLEPWPRFLRQPLLGAAVRL